MKILCKYLLIKRQRYKEHISPSYKLQYNVPIFLYNLINYRRRKNSLSGLKDVVD